LEFSGAAPAEATVSVAVDGGTAETVDRSAAEGQVAELDSFRTVIPLATDQAEGRWVNVAVTSSVGTGTEAVATTQDGWLFAPPAMYPPVHDLDGNLVEDARWTYEWDAENRLIAMEEKPFGMAAGLDPATAPKRQRLEFGYDARHRRVRKVVKAWQGDLVSGGFELVKDRRYVYDGWNMIVELDHLTATDTGLAGATVVRTQVWGLDLSGTPQGAGGVGGLLAVRHNSQSYAPLLDGNGNVMGLYGLGGEKEGQVVARYDYDAFGNRITNTAPQLGEEVNPFGFSTKFTDEETGLVYYGYRYYDPVTGRWPSRDPIGEEGGLNLYGMVGNDPVNFFDYLGLDTYIFLYYSRSDQQAFKQAAETQKREIEASSTFNKACDKVIIKGALTAQDFESAWSQAKTETTGNDPNLKVKEVRVFSHSGLGELHFKGGSLNTQQIANLSGLNWKPDGKVVCHGCNSGVNNASGQSVAGGFAQGQGVQSQGQTGYSQFSTDPNKRGWFTRIDDSSKSVYLWSHGDGGKDNTFGPTRPPNTVPPPAPPTPAPPLP
jgi:RHS repeat-associated protein